MSDAEALAWLDGLQGRGMKFRLDAMHGALARMGHPHERAPVFHIAGSNGKGSVVAFLSSILREAGYDVGMYTSPHLVHVRERIVVNGEPIPAAEFVRGIRTLRPVVDELEARGDAGLVTYFEALTLLAYWWFAECEIDIGVIEVGLGGRLDATNVHARPLATVVTNITLEHTKLLGDTVEAIAGEKAGILREGVPVITAAREGALRVIEERARSLHAPLRSLPRDFAAERIDATRDAQELILLGMSREYGTLRTRLPGIHQIENIACAVAAIESALPIGGAPKNTGLNVPIDAVQRGIENARWPGRLQWLRRDPALLIDGAHNPGGVESLVQFLEENKIRPTVVFGCLSDKDWPVMVGTLAPAVHAAVVVAPPSDRALDPRELGSAFARNGVIATVATDVRHALATARGQTPEGGVVAVAGSLFLAGEVLKILGEKGV
ncbi:MAG: bifunctional folylpolyglutamate synthase/dihydrofolate synthase [Thermoplasmatota archaeon]